MFGIRSGVALAAGLGLAAVTTVTALLPASSFADSPTYVALLNGTSEGQQGPQDVLDIRGASKAVDAEAICFVAGGSNLDGNPTDNQLWELRPTGEKSDGADFVNIINKHSGKDLAVPPDSPAGASVVQVVPSGLDIEEWLEFSPNGGNGLVFKNKASGMVLDAAGVDANHFQTCGSGFPGSFAHIVQFPENDNPNQLWFFFP